MAVQPREVRENAAGRNNGVRSMGREQWGAVVSGAVVSAINLRLNNNRKLQGNS